MPGVVVDNRFFDCHCHVFSLQQIPKIDALVGNEDDLAAIAQVLAPFGLAHQADFLRDAIPPTAQIFAALSALYLAAHQGGAQAHLFVPLAIDFGCQHEQHRALYGWQLDSLLRLKCAFPDVVLPFVGVDPRRRSLGRDIDIPGLLIDGRPTRLQIPARITMLELVEQYVGPGRPFHGVKLYPSFGFYPDDPRLDALYQLCEARAVPITTHCQNDGGLAPRLVAALTGDLAGLAAVAATWHDATRPARWWPVLRRFPGLHLNLAHFGGVEEMRAYAAALSRRDAQAAAATWTGQIIALLEEPAFANLYTDVAAAAFVDPAFVATIKRIWLQHPGLRERVLYGSDYFMTSNDHPRRALTEMIRQLFWYRTGSRGRLDRPLSSLLSNTNPRRFLGV